MGKYDRGSEWQLYNPERWYVRVGVTVGALVLVGACFVSVAILFGGAYVAMN